jgi:hypothetical protein
VGTLFRLGHWYDESFQQGSPLLVPGARVQWFIPLGKQRELSLRYDARANLFRQSDEWTTSVTHGFAVGIALR